MKRRARKKTGVRLLVALILVFSGCATRKKIQPEQVLSLPRHHLEAGEYGQAIAAFSSAYQAHPGEKAIQEAFINGLEIIRQSADRAFERKDYSLAEKTYSLLFENVPAFKTFQESLSFSRKYLNERIKACRLGRAKEKTGKAFELGDFEQALAEMQSLVRIYPRDADVLASLISLSRDIKKTVDLALAREDYITSGKASSALLKNYPLLEKTGTDLPFSSRGLEEGIQTCRAKLTKKGLEQYRKGNLSEAIFLWQGLLAFDPDNTEIKKAVETAAEQLKKIKKK